MKTIPRVGSWHGVIYEYGFALWGVGGLAYEGVVKRSWLHGNL
jgi:hypothetical protein